MLIIDNEGQEVHGQLFTSPALDAKLSELDQLEGEEYTRTVLTAVLKDGTQVKAFAYVLAGQEQ